MSRAGRASKRVLGVGGWGLGRKSKEKGERRKKEASSSPLEQRLIIGLVAMKWRA
jgi:hypothetical protein